MSKLISINPSNYKEIGSVEISSYDEVRIKVDLAHKSKVVWKNLGTSKRVELLRAVFDEIKQRKEEIALLEAQEMGTPLTDALIDVDGTWIMLTGILTMLKST